MLGAIVALISGFIPLEIMGTLSSVGALFSFMMVCIAVMVLRKRYPDVKRPFKCPVVHLIAGFGALLCLTLLVAALEVVGIYTAIWVLTGIAFYFVYYRMRA
jgi:APA family basic amino acid/polyamine antiporter